MGEINFGMGDLVGGTIGRSRGGGRLGHGGVFLFFGEEGKKHSLGTSFQLFCCVVLVFGSCGNKVFDLLSVCWVRGSGDYDRKKKGKTLPIPPLIAFRFPHVTTTSTTFAVHLRILFILSTYPHV
jgi:hypothetical protein